MKNSKILFFTLSIYLMTVVSSHIVNQHIQLDLSNKENRFSLFEDKFFNDNVDKDIIKINNSKELLVKTVEFLNENSSSEYEDVCEKKKDFDKPEFYYFLPTFKGKITKMDQIVNFSSPCFRDNKISFEKLTLEETIIVINSSNPKHLLCGDSYWINTSNIHVLKEIFNHGEHKIVLKNLHQDDLDEIAQNGVKVMNFCQGLFSGMHSLFNSLKLYVGGLGKNPDAKFPILKPSVPKYMENANKDFLSRFAKFNPQHRGKAGESILDIDEKDIKTGDFIAIYRLDGLDPLIMWGSGSRIGHSAVACWIDGELYVLESQDGWYWPKRGIQRNKWKQWVQWAHNADFNVAILPLKEEIRQKFNVEAALHWFTNGIEGLNYGYHNFLFSWLDTPDSNLPLDVLQMESLLPVFAVLEKVSKPTATLIIGEALNQRTQTKGLSIPQVVAEAARRGLSFEQLISLPEMEEWKYNDGTNYTCSCFVTAFYLRAGILGDITIQPQEFTPKDVYQLNIFDNEYKDKRPKVCQEADPELPYCQVIGKYQVLLDGFSTIAPYSKMNESCPSIAPEYFRPQGC